MVEIADAAQIARATLHRYFATRDEVLEACWESARHAAAEGLGAAEVEGGPPGAALERALRVFLVLGDRYALLLSGKEPPLPNGDDLRTIAAA
jgi:AcrR family transcriptional regulator